MTTPYETLADALPRKPFNPFVPRVRHGKVSITDGPFAETKECLAGFYLIEAADLNDAIKIASQIPPARVGAIEVRPVRELTSAGGETRHL